MKKLTALLLCFLLLCTCCSAAFAAESEKEDTNTVISVTVPDSHKVTVTAENAKVFYEGISREEFAVGRLSEPRLLVRAESGKVIKSVTLNGVDVTDLLHGGYLQLAPVYEDKMIVVTTEDEPVVQKQTYTVKGKVTLNGQPLANVELELRSTLKTAKTDNNGNFIFTDVEPGKHSLSALNGGEVIGYLSFELQQDKKSDVSLAENGTYTVSMDQDGAGVELQLVMNKDERTIALAGVKNVQKADPDLPQTGDDTSLFWWGFLLALSAACIVVLETCRRKKKQ